MASLFARHGRKCRERGGIREFTRFDEVVEGCTCRPGPSFVIVVPEGDKRRKIGAGRNRKEAERAFRKLEVEVDEGAYRPQENARFDKWGDRWLDSLERKKSTRQSYESTVKWAKQAFGSKNVRQVTTSDIARMNVLMREAGVSDSTRAKHLRVLGACLSSAVQHGYAARNAVRELPKGEKPRAAKREAAYFENDELPRLFQAIPEGFHRTLFLTALKTGIRQGELLALTWDDVDLLSGTIRVRRTLTKGGQTSPPKSHERRDVDIGEDLVTLLGEWWGACGEPAEGNTLVFAGATGFLEPTSLLRVLYAAMTSAGVPRVGPTGEKRTFHSLRHTFAKRALESGAEITWLQRHLGHSSITVTVDRYGHWERSERKRQAKLLEGAFNV